MSMDTGGPVGSSCGRIVKITEQEFYRMSNAEPSIDPLKLLQALAEARAILYRAGDFDLAEATGPLFAYAIDAGIGTEQAQNIINTAFDGALNEHGERAD